MSARRFRPWPTLAVVFALAACSGSTSGTVASQGASQGASRGASPSAERSVPSAAQGSTASAGQGRVNPSAAGRATCSALPAASAARLLGVSVTATTRDVRANSASRREEDGCTHATASGQKVGYLVWTLATKGGRADVVAALPQPRTGVTTFDPRLGDVSAGAVMAMGPLSLAQVNVVRGTRLVQVTVLAQGTASAGHGSAREIAVAAARTVLTATGGAG